MRPPKRPEVTHARRVALASLIGTSVEYYDYFIYGTAAALVFPTVFFPDESPVASSLLSYATFGVGFLARPLGGAVFGHYGDRIGRKPLLVISLLMMGVATLVIGLMPTYAQIGVVAPIALTVTRLLQGFAVGGEWGGATLMAVEHAPTARKGFFGSFPQTGAPVGVLLANVAFFLVSAGPHDWFLTTGWRIPFLFGAVLVGVGLVIRMYLQESPEFTRAVATDGPVRFPLVDAFRRQWREILLVAGGYLSQGVFAYICIVYVVSYATTNVGIGKQDALFGVGVAALLSIFLSPYCGALGDRFGRKRIYLLGAALMAASIAPAFALINTGRPAMVWLALILVFGIAMSLVTGVTGSLFSMLFETSVRFSGASVGYAISQILGSATAPLIATALFAATHTTDSVVWYLLGVSLISLISVAAMPDDRRTPAPTPAPLTTAATGSVEATAPEGWGRQK